MQLTIYKDEQGLVNQVRALAEGADDAKALTEFNSNYAKAKLEAAKAAANLAEQEKASADAIAEARANLAIAEKAEAAAEAAKAALASAEAAKPVIAQAKEELAAAQATQSEASQVQAVVPSPATNWKPDPPKHV
jgi:colicin import membrane protein